MIEGLDRIEVITLLVDDLAAATAFYRNVLGLPLVASDDNSAVVELANVLVNLLRATEAPTLVEHGVPLLTGPVDRPWGPRTAAFADPAGNVWEVAQLLPDV